MSKIEAIRDLRALVPSLLLIDAKRLVETATNDYLAEIERRADLRVECMRGSLDIEREATRLLRDSLQRAEERIRALEEAVSEHVLGRTRLPSIGFTSFPDDALPF